MVSAYEWTSSNPNPLIDFLQTVQAYRSAGKKIVTTNGCFDIMHNGHIKFLDQARALGDILIVGLNSDAAVKRIKGAGRPIVNEQDRAAMLAALRSVDHVVVFDEDLPTQLLAEIKPAIHCKAGDYSAEGLPEAETVRKNGGEIKILPLIPGYSTSSFIERILVSQKMQVVDSEENLLSVRNYFLSSGNVLRQTGYQLSDVIVKVARLVAQTLRNNHKIILCGNGGSAADAQHFAAELVGRFRFDRQAWPAISLSSDPSIVTSIGNDYGFEQLYARQVSAWGQDEDILVAISTSGTSPNVLAAVQEAKKQNMKIVGLTGKKPSALQELSDLSLAVPSLNTPQIQQAHMAILHAICDLVEQELTPKADN